MLVFELEIDPVFGISPRVVCLTRIGQLIAHLCISESRETGCSELRHIFCFTLIEVSISMHLVLNAFTKVFCQLLCFVKDFAWKLAFVVRFVNFSQFSCVCWMVKSIIDCYYFLSFICIRGYFVQWQLM